MDINQIRELVEKDEEMLFSGCFNENIVRFDMSTRREKRNTYIVYFNRFIDDHRTISNAVRTQDAELAEKSKKCQKEASRLLDIVYSY